MAGTIKTNAVQLGDSTTATHNFTLQTNVNGTAKLARGNVGATTQDILTIDAAGVVGAEIKFLQSGTGAVGRTLDSKARESVSVKDFGAVGDGVADDTAAIQKAIDALPVNGGVLYFGRKHMLSAPLLVSARTNITFEGENTVLACGASRILCYFNVVASTDIKFKAFVFDSKKQDMPLYTAGDYGTSYNVGVKTSAGADNIEISNCSFINLYTVAVSALNTNKLRVLDSCFESPTQTQTQSLEFVSILSSAEATVSRCIFNGTVTTGTASNPCGIVASGIREYITIDNCQFNYCGRDNTGTHRLGVIDFYFDVDNVTVTNCTSRNTMAEFMRLSACKGGNISDNSIYFNSNAEVGVNGISTQSGAFFTATANKNCTNVTIANNRILADTAGRVATAIGVYSYDWGAPSDHIRVHNNVVVNADKMVVVEGPFFSVHVKDNTSKATANNFMGQIQVSHRAGITALYDVEANAYFRDLSITGNTITSVNDNGNITVSLAGFVTTAKVTDFNISDNRLLSQVLSSSVGINVDLSSTTPADTVLIIANNVIKKYFYVFQVSNSGRVVLDSNKRIDNSNYLIQGGNTSFVDLNSVIV